MENKVRGCQLPTTTVVEAQEMLLRLNPDWIFLFSVTYLLSSKLIKSLPAVRPNAARQTKTSKMIMP
jgi:hypothetical protein